MSNVLLSSAVTIRHSLIQQVQSIPEELFDIIPEPFTNSIDGILDILSYLIIIFSL